jgi:outer membrane protein assembly factor BamB
MTFAARAAAAAVAACAITVTACGGPVTAPDQPHAAVSSQPPPSASATAVRKPWPQRAVLPEDATLQDASQVLDPAAGVLYALIPDASGSAVLQAIDLRTGRVRRGTSYRVSGLALAAGYLWVYGSPGPGGPYILDQVSPRTLATIRAGSVPGNPNETAAPVAGPAGSVWAGADRTLLRISVRTGAVLTRAVLPAGLELTGLAASPATTTVYASAVRLRPGGAVVLEYSESTGRRLAQSGAGDLKWSLDGAWLAALPDGVWVWFRSGMLGQSELLSSRSLRVVAGFPGTVTPADSPATGPGTIYDWAMGSSAAYAGGALWVVTNSGVVACVNPATGRVRAQETVTSEPVLVAPDPAARQIVVVGDTGVVAITPPRDCWP